MASKTFVFLSLWMNHFPPPLHSKTSLTPPVSPKSKSPRILPTKGGNNDNNNNLLNSSSEKVVIPRHSSTKVPTLERKKSKSFKEGSLSSIEASLSYSSSLITDSPGSIAAVRREQMALQQAQRKMKITHYGRSKSAKFERVVVPLDPSTTTNFATKSRQGYTKPTDDPIFVFN